MIILFNPQSNPSKKAILPMSILALAAVFEGHHAYQIVDGNLVEDSLKALTASVLENNVTIIAMTIMPGPQMVAAAPISAALKERFPELIIIWGGYFPTLYPKSVMAGGNVDYAFRGHSEKALFSFISGLLEGECDLETEGLVYNSGESGECVTNPLAPLPKFEDLPSYPYHKIDMNRYPRPTFMGQKTLSHHSSYGCPFLCNFCGVVNMVSGRYVAEAPERTLEAVRKLTLDYGADAIEFFDNNFFVQEDRVVAVAKGLIPLKLKWWAYGRIDTMLQFSEETWQLLKESGLAMVYLGAESGSAESLKHMNKGGKLTSSHTLQISKKMYDYGIVPELSFVMGSPPDPDTDISATIKLIREVKILNPNAEVIFYKYTPVPLEGELLDAARDAGFKFPETLEEWSDPKWVDFVHRKQDQLPWLSKEQDSRIQNFQRVMNCAYPTVTDPNLIGLKRTVLKLLGGWRYALRFYALPIDLKIVNRLLPHRRPETSGF